MTSVSLSSMDPFRDCPLIVHCLGWCHIYIYSIIYDDP